MGNVQSNVSPLYKCLDEAMPPLSGYVFDKNTWYYVETGMKGAYTDERDREAFLISLSTVLAASSERLLEDQSNVTFKLLFSRRADPNTPESISPQSDALPRTTAGPDSSQADDSQTIRPASGVKSCGSTTAASTSSWWKRQFGAFAEQEEIMASLVILNVRTGRLIAKVQPLVYGRNQLEAFKCFRKDIERRLEIVLAKTASALPDDDGMESQSAYATQQSLSELPAAERTNDSSPADQAYEVPFGDLIDVAPPSYEKVAATRG